MKSILSLFIAFLVIGNLSSQESYIIQGSVEIDSLKGQIVLSTFDPIKQVKNKIGETSILEDGSFEISFLFKHPDLYRLDLPDRLGLYLTIDEGQKLIQVMLDEKKEFAVDGSSDTKKLMAYDFFRKQSNLKWVRPTYQAMSAASKSGDQEAEIAAVEAYVKNSKIHRKELIDFSEKEIGNSIALFGTALRWTGDDEISRLEILVNNFARKYPDLPMTKSMQEKVNRYKKVAIGAHAANIVGQDLSGSAIELNKQLGKYTLIDFWASWCRPCILQIPDLQKSYAEFSSKGFEIFSFSVDRSESKWIEAAGKYDMPWVHASDVKGWQSQVAADYNVTFVPFNLLLDQEGKIIAKNLHHKTLYNFLNELFERVE